MHLIVGFLPTFRVVFQILGLLVFNWIIVVGLPSYHLPRLCIEGLLLRFILTIVLNEGLIIMGLWNERGVPMVAVIALKFGLHDFETDQGDHPVGIGLDVLYLVHAILL